MGDEKRATGKEEIKIENGKPRSVLRNGFCDGLIPLKHIDLSKVNNFSDLTAAMGHTALGARAVGEAADILYEITADNECFNVLTLSGIMTVAKMGLIISDMIEKGMINAIVSTGALIAHGFVEGTGMAHFKYQQNMNDKKLYYAGYDRIYDTLELETNLDDAEVLIDKILRQIGTSKPTCSRELISKFGEHLSKHPGKSILRSAFKKGVPIYIPAFTDSELGLDFALFNRKMLAQNKKPLSFDPFLDLEHFTGLLSKQKKLGIFTIGGGVPRNWAQQFGPYIDIIKKRHKSDEKFQRYQYGIRICPEPVHWGGLSGATYSEGVSWGKFMPADEGGKFAEVYCDATIALPLIVKAVIERLEKDKKG